ncbi:MAG: murein L,D-transpeptidase catalytic domain family protein [Coxiellaceae bacterium]|nr:murein L,D-transpeptidase catalytic domain family protein [Coxiellaceae bacterium]
MKLILLVVLLITLLGIDFSRKGLTLHANKDAPVATPTPKPITKSLDAKAIKSLSKTKLLLQRKANGLPPSVIDKVMNTLYCAKRNELDHNNILTIIDFSQPSNKKRLWVFDLAKSKLLYNTYVSHGLKSGSFNSTYFSNKNNSKATSIGVFNTEKKYYGRYGIALKLLGLEPSINDNAYNRFIVMHGSWYVNERFIKKYGRAGRSWGCPSLPLNVVKPIINTIKDNSIMVAYYPSDDWLNKSDFLHCDGAKKTTIEAKALNKQDENRGDIVFVDLNNNDKKEKDEPIIVVTADFYKKAFNKQPPLKRMLRRQIKKTEYIALDNKELVVLDSNKDKKLSSLDKGNFKKVYIVVPEVKKLRGYWATEMKIKSLGKIKQVNLQPVSSIKFENKPTVFLKSTNKFIRWLGL